jgi:hypothetical protein
MEKTEAPRRLSHAEEAYLMAYAETGQEAFARQQYAGALGDGHARVASVPEHLWQTALARRREVVQRQWAEHELVLDAAVGKAVKVIADVIGMFADDGPARELLLKSPKELQHVVNTSKWLVERTLGGVSRVTHQSVVVHDNRTLQVGSDAELFELGQKAADVLRAIKPE